MIKKSFKNYSPLFKDKNLRIIISVNENNNLSTLFWK